MNRRALWLASWLLCIFLASPLRDLPEARTQAQMQENSLASIARATLAWLAATGVSVFILRRWFLRGSDLKRARQVGLTIGLLAAPVFTAELILQVASHHRVPFLPPLALNIVTTGLVGYAVAYWRLTPKAATPGAPDRK